MNIQFERKLVGIKCLVLILISMTFWMYLGASYGKAQDAQFMGMIFAAVIGMLFIIEYLQIFPIIIKHVFRLEFFEKRDDYEIFFVQSKAPFSISFESFHHKYILISQACSQDEKLLEILIQYETLRIQRGLAWFHTLFMWSVAFFPMCFDFLFFVLPHKTVLRYLFAFLGNIVRLISYPFLYVLYRILYPPNTYLENEQLLTIQIRKSISVIQVLQYLYACKSSNSFMYFCLLPMFFTGPEVFGAFQKLWKSYFFDLKERISLLKSVVG